MAWISKNNPQWDKFQEEWEQKMENEMSVFNDNFDPQWEAAVRGDKHTPTDPNQSSLAGDVRSGSLRVSPGTRNKLDNPPTPF